MSRHAAARRPRSAWLTLWTLEAWARWAARTARARIRANGRRLLLAVACYVAYYVIALLAVETLAMLISGGK